MMRDSYNRELYQNPQIRLRWFLPLIKKAVETGEEITTQDPVPLNGLDYTLYFIPKVKTDADGQITLYLRWLDGGEIYRQRIPIIREESNLIPGTFVYFFLSPSGHKSKKLFYICNLFRSRRSFVHIYFEQKRSRLQRQTEQLSRDEPYRRYGKTLYRGKLTPYGKRCARYEKQQEDGLEFLYSEILKLKTEK